MNVRTKQKAIGCFMKATEGNRADMCGLESRQSFLPGSGATAAVKIHYHHSECTLPESRSYENGFAKHRMGPSTIQYDLGLHS